jgi:hypothetical protein
VKIMRKLLLTAAVMLLSISSCLASSKTYQLAGTCDGGDMVYKWGINGRPGADGSSAPPQLTNTPGNVLHPNWPAPGTPGSSFIYPFTQNDILIYGIEIVMLPGAPGAPIPAHTWWMPGNNVDGDTMLWVPADQIRAVNFFPPGREFRFPGIGNENNMTYVDLHGSCAAGQWATIMYTIYYVNAPPPAPPSQ